ncbi:FUSC family protein [Streptomyces sp. NPDC001262]|uniref:FUSC family protein n=1 Tax=Streptomyces sp. NPDC001262 TaxID=3364552 RepID=UPI0036B3BE0A
MAELMCWGLGTGHRQEAAVAACGIVMASSNDRNEPHRSRLLRVTLPSLASAVGFLLGHLVAGSLLATFALLTCAAFLSGAVGAIGPVCCAAGVALLGSIAIAQGIHLGGPWWKPPVLSLAGAVLVVLPSLLTWPIRRRHPERQTLATVLRRHAELLAVLGTAREGAARRAASLALGHAHDALHAHRLTDEPPNREGLYLARLLAASEHLEQAGAVVASEGNAVPAEFITALEHAAERITRGMPLHTLKVRSGSGTALPAALAHAWEDLCSAASAATARGPERQTLRAITAAARRSLAPAAGVTGLRLAVCFGVAVVAEYLLGESRSYWVPMTVAFVFRPEFASPATRSLHRLLGTIAGSALVTAVLAVLPLGWPLVPAAAVSMGAMALLGTRHYALATTGMTVSMLIFIELGHWEPAAPGLRTVCTLLAVLTVAVTGYLGHPSGRHLPIRLKLADAAHALAHYAEETLAPGSHNRPGLHRKAARALTAAEAELLRAKGEPPFLSDRTTAWAPTVTALHELLADIPTVRMRMDADTRAIPHEQVAQLAQRLRVFGRAVIQADTEPAFQDVSLLRFDGHVDCVGQDARAAPYSSGLR